MLDTAVQLDEFFSTARERYRIKLRRDSNEPFPWTHDPIFCEWRFTNVHREDDKTTVWFRDTVRDILSYHSRAQDENHTPEQKLPALLAIVQATLIFRWFNRIETGKMIKDLLLYGWDTDEARDRLTGISPIVTGAYIIKAGDGVSKLEGILDCIDGALPQLPEMVVKWGGSLYRAWKDLQRIHFMGGFMAYEVVTDLRWTPVLDTANDIMTWGNLGPGAIRGMGRVILNEPTMFRNSVVNQAVMLDLMGKLLKCSRDEKYWPQDWPRWEMHEVEMWLCEYAKYCNAKDGQRLKRRYRQ